MFVDAHRPGRAPVPPRPDSVRLLAGVPAAGRPVGLDEHLERWGVLPRWKGSTLIEEMERSGLRGRGGGWFPVATKWRAVHRVGMRRPVVVANGSESEPASGKDRLLLCQLPHLVLDGAVAAAISIGAPDVVVHVPAFARRRGRPRPRRTAPSGSRPLRHRRGDSSRQLPGRTGVGGGQHHQREKRRAYRRSWRSGRCVSGAPAGRPTLVQNVESLAHASLIARFGAQWFRSVGTAGVARARPF